MLNVAGHEPHLSPYPMEPCQKCRILEPCDDQQPSAGSSQEKKTDHIRASCELPKEHMCYLEKLVIWMLEDENLFWKLLSAFQIWPWPSMIFLEKPEEAKSLTFLLSFCISSKVKSWRNNVTVLWFLDTHTLTMQGSLCGWTVNFWPDEVFPYS